MPAAAPSSSNDALTAFLTEQKEERGHKKGRRESRRSSKNSAEDTEHEPPTTWDPSFHRNSSVTALLKGVPAKTKHDRDLGELLACMWEHGSKGADTIGGKRGDGRTFTCTATMADDTFAGAVGPRLMPYGLSEFTLSILKSDDNSGTGMLLGIAEDVGGAAPNGKWGRIWGVGPWNGRVFGFPEMCARAADRSGEVRGEAVLGGADLRGRACGAAVSVRFDADARRLYFRLGTSGATGAWSVAKDDQGKPLELPLSVRAFARAARQGDAIAISNATFTANDAAIPADALREGAMPKANAKSADSRRSSSELAAVSVPSAAPANASQREADLLKQVELLNNQLNDLKLSLARERQLRQQVEKEAEHALIQYNAPAGRRGSLADRNAERRNSRELVK